MREGADTYKIEMDGRWNLRDLYELPHAYLQVYAFYYWFDSADASLNHGRIDRALRSYPWQGGFSVVNIYTVLQNQLVNEHRPDIKEIRYASPGWIELYASLPTAAQVATTVTALAATAVPVAKAATSIAKAYSELLKVLASIREHRRNQRINNLLLDAKELKALQKLSKEVAAGIGFKSIDQLIERSGDVEIAAKLLTAQYRRLEALAKMVREGKATLPVPPTTQSRRPDPDAPHGG